MSARPIGSKSGRVTLGECIAAIDDTERAVMLMIGSLEIAADIRDALTDIAAPLYALLRRAGKRNGALPAGE